MQFRLDSQLHLVFFVCYLANDHSDCLWKFFSLREMASRILVIAIVFYLTWYMEYRRKQEFIQMWEISKMNDELKIILTKHMPDGIILID